MAICYPSCRDPCGQPPIQSTLHLSLPERGFDFGLSPAVARIWGNPDLNAVEIAYLDPSSGDSWVVTVSPTAAIDFALVVARVATELDDEQGDPT